jgi:hypothetical protein
VTYAQESAGAAESRTSGVIEELRLLPRGRGVLADDIDNRLGPWLRDLLGVDSRDDPGVVRRKVAARLSVLADRLPEDLGHAVRAALALGDVATDRFLKDRVGRLAAGIQRDPRTAKRRVDEGLRRLAEMLVEAAEPPAASNPFAPEGWYIRTLNSVLLLDREPPQLFERRRVVATRSGLDHVLISLSAPSPENRNGSARPPVGLDVLQGGVVVEETSTGSHYRASLGLPHALAVGEEHEFTVVFTSRPRREMRPYYTLTPLRPCESFGLTVRFDRADPPASVWRLDGLPPRMVTEYDPGRNEFDVDAIGEVGVSFSDLRPGLAYGIGWSSPRDGDAVAFELDG